MDELRHDAPVNLDPRQRRNKRISIAILTAIVLGLYFGYIVFKVVTTYH